MRAELNRIIVIDVEATCWETREEQGSMPNEIIEIGACELNVKTGEIGNRAQILVSPAFTKVSPFCTKLTGWTPEEIEAEGLPIEHAIAEFTRIYNPTEATIWCSCGDYDRNMLSSKSRQGLAMYKLSSPNPFDNMRLHINVKTLMALRFKLSREMGMGAALNYLNEKLEGAHHNGCDDAYNIAKILRRVLS